MRILLTNDDGIQAEGVRALYHAIKDAGHEVHCVAPISEMSAVGHAITMSTPLRVKDFKENGFRGQGVSGTPADCVKLALTTLMDERPDLVVSGINAGANVGVDILYSGTVSAATEGALMGLPAMAVSMDDFNPIDLAEQAAFAVRFLESQDWPALPAQRVVNLNFPKIPMGEVKGVKVCCHTDVAYNDWYDSRTDPRGRIYHWLVGEIPADKLAVDTDRALLTAGYITVTPLRFDFTDRDCLERIKIADIWPN
jgi:5'-nucleotidase